MAYNSHNLKTDASGVKPLSQVYDPALDDLDVLTGASLGSNRYGMDVIQWGKTTGGVYVPIQVDENGIQQMSLAGSNATYAFVTSSVAAGSSTGIYLDSQLGANFNNYSQVGFAINTNDTTNVNWGASLQYFLKSGEISGYSKFGTIPLIASAQQYNAYSNMVEIYGDHPYLQITNNDTAAHSFGVIVKLKQ